MAGPSIMVSVAEEQDTTLSQSMTTGTTTTYIQRCARASATAAQHDPLTLLFYREKLGRLAETASPDEMQEHIYQGNLGRLRAQIASGGVIAESHDFAVVACWSLGMESPMSEDELQAISCERPLFADFLRQMAQIRKKYVDPKFGNRCWYLSLMARDPSVAYVPGAVRAVIDPFLQRAREEGTAAWLIAGSPRARDIYAHFGFRVVEVLRSESVNTWAMIFDPSQS